MITNIFDTETTDLVKPLATPLEKQPEIIQIHIEKFDDGQLVDTFSSFVKPFKPVPDFITDITSITNAMVDDAPRWLSIQSDVQAFMLDGVDEVAAHNLSFDMDMVNIEAKRTGHQFLWPVNRICTVEQTEHIKGRRLDLMSLHEHLFGEGFEKAHLAQNDVAALARCFFRLRELGEL